MKRKLYKISSLCLGLLCLVFIIKIINLIYKQNGLIENTYSNDYVVNKNNNLSMMLETEYDSNQYELATSNEWPTDGYVFNAELSACKNGSQVSWDSDTNSVVVYAGSVDSCYIYFDKEPDITYFANYIKNVVYTGVDGENDLYYHDGVGSYNNASEEAGDNSYRYAGANPNNYVCFGSDDSICSYDNLYRIIGVFGNNVKLIKYDYATSSILGTNGSFGSSSPASNYSNYKGSHSTLSWYFWNNSTNNNTWSTSNINLVNLNTNYLNYLNGINSKWDNMIESCNWQVGGNTNDNIYNVNIKNTYLNEIVSPITNITYSAKIGLMYVSDYGYAVSPSAWTTNLSSYNTVASSNWMNMGGYDWTITRNSDNSINVYTLYDTGYIGYGYINNSNGINFYYGIRPTFYLNSNVKYVSGDGSSSSPYRIALD